MVPFVSNTEMSNCLITGHIRKRDGELLAGAVVSIDRVVIDNAENTDYETTATSDADGAVSFSVPSGARVRFASSDVSSIDGYVIDSVPDNTTFDIGVFIADDESETEASANFAPKTEVVAYTDSDNDLTITNDDNGKTFTNNGADGPITFRPDLANLDDGWTATFVNIANELINIYPLSGHIAGRCVAVDSDTELQARVLNTAVVALGSQYSTVTLQKCGGKLLIIAANGDIYDND